MTRKRILRALLVYVLTTWIFWLLTKDLTWAILTGVVAELLELRVQVVKRALRWMHARARKRREKGWVAQTAWYVNPSPGIDEIPRDPFGRFRKRVEPLDQPHSPEELARIEEELERELRSHSRKKK